MSRRALSILIVFMLFSALPMALIGSYGTTVTGGYTECDTSLQLLPASRDIGGGTVHWRITGEQARLLRELILDRLDNATINKVAPNDTSQGRQIGVIDEYEVRKFVGDSDSFLQSYIEGQLIKQVNYSHKNPPVNPYEPLGTERYSHESNTTFATYYYGVKITHSALSNYNVYSDTDGLIGRRADSMDSIDIYMTIKMDSPPKAATIDLSDTDFLSAPFRCLDKWEKVYDNNTHRWRSVLLDRVDYRGDGVLNHFNIEVGFDSYSYPKVQKGSIWMLRTPAGEIFSYTIEVQSGMTPKETIQHATFDPLENPQILFIIVAIFGYLSVAFPTHFFLEYRNAYPKRYRLEARKIKAVHWTGRTFLLLLLLFYFFPIIGPVYFSGPIMIAMSIIFVIISAGVSKATYEKAIEKIPKEYFEEEKKKVKRIKKAPKPVAAPVNEEYMAEPLPIYGEEEEERIHCIKCGSLIKIKEGENLLKVKCPVCGALQRRVEQGYNHLILDSELKNTYNMLADFLRDGYLALCMSTTFPDKLKRTYNLGGKLKCIWLTNAGGKDTIDPSNIEKIAEVVERFSQKYPASIILFDGLEYLVVEHGFDEAMKLVKKMTDIASMMDMTLIVPINPAALTGDELSKLRAEFDRVEALEDKDERSFY